MEMTTRNLEDHHITLFVISGELDAQTSPQAQANILPACTTGCRLLLDMSQVTYMSSMGLQLVLLLYNQMLRVNGSLVFAGFSEHIRGTLAAMGFLPYLNTCDTVEDGVTFLNSKT